MSDLVATKKNDSNHIIKEKKDIVMVQKHLEKRHARVKSIISTMFCEMNKDESKLKKVGLDTSERSMLEYDISCSQSRLEKAIYEKELIRKDLAIVQTRLRYLEDEINKTKPWWFNIFRGKK